MFAIRFIWLIDYVRILYCRIAFILVAVLKLRIISPVIRHATTNSPYLQSRAHAFKWIKCDNLACCRKSPEKTKRRGTSACFILYSLPLSVVFLDCFGQANILVPRWRKNAYARRRRRPIRHYHASAPCCQIIKKTVFVLKQIFLCVFKVGWD